MKTKPKFDSLLKCEPVGLFFLRIDLTDYTNPENLNAIMHRVTKVHDQCQGSLGNTFLPRFTFTEIDTVLRITIHDNKTGKAWSHVDTVIDETQNFSLVLADSNWCGLEKGKRSGISFTGLKVFLNPVFESMSKQQAILLRSFMSSLQRLPAEGKRKDALLSFDLDIGDSGLMITAYYQKEMLTVFGITIKDSVPA